MGLIAVPGSDRRADEMPTTVGSMQTAELLDDCLARHLDVARDLRDAHDAAWAAVDPILLELARLRVAMLLRCDAEFAVRTEAAVLAGLQETTIAQLANWPTSPRFGARERACLAFTEQFVIDVASMGNDLPAAVADHLGPSGLADFSTALLVIEQRQRLRLAWTELFVPVGNSQPTVPSTSHQD